MVPLKVACEWTRGTAAALPGRGTRVAEQVRPDRSLYLMTVELCSSNCMSLKGLCDACRERMGQRLR